ncbi:MAG TPA: fibronectin type III domain-containing protein, partial [Actinotalea sp.]|nr:fibronectin type III domain-containing protein [Actinotalea sp.]
LGVVLGEQAITVTWDEPASTGGDPIVGYRVGVDGVWSQVPGGGAARSYTFPAVPGRRYAVAVQAYNTVGTGPSADNTGQIWTAPGPVVALAAVDVAAPGTAWGDGAVELTWSVPAVTGGEGITVDRYRIEVLGIATYETSATSYTVRGLLGGAGQQFTVAARNSQGEWGPATAVGATPSTVPDVVAFGAPDLTAAPRVTFSWQAPADGGAPVTSYRVVVTGDRGTTVRSEQAGRSIVVDAKPGETLTVTVEARNALGLGAPSVLPDVVVPDPVAPAAPGG